MTATTTTHYGGRVREFMATRGWLILPFFLGWSLLAAIPATSAYLGAGAPGVALWWAMFKKIGLYYYLWGLVTPLLYRLTDRLPWRGRALPLTICVHGVVLAALSFTFGMIAHGDLWREWLLGARAMGYHSMSLFTYLLIVLCSLALKFYRLSVLREKEATAATLLAAQLDNQLSLARVSTLQMQMNPHFLFNALNSIAALIDARRGDRAYDAVEKLADLLRQALRLSTAEDVALSREIEFCRAYLRMEQVRFGDRLNVVWRLEHQVDYQVPAFILQPAVENAIKHAVSRSSVTVTIKIHVVETRGALVLRIEDDHRATGPQTTVTGIGMTNLRERLTLRYGPDIRVDTGSTETGFCARISLPIDKLATVSSA